MAFATAREVVATFFDGLIEEPTQGRYATLALMHPDAHDAALTYLRGRYIDRIAAAEPWERTDVAGHIVSMMLARRGKRVEDALVDVALGCASPADLRQLGDIVADTVPAERLAQAIVAALDRDEATRFRAAELAYHTFDASAGELEPSPDLAILMAEKLRLYHRQVAARAATPRA